MPYKYSAIASQKTKERLRRFRAARPGYSTAKNRKWQAANPEKRAAHKAVEVAVINGRLQRQPCERCGAANAQAHHDDYSKVLSVIWLCQFHHRQRHKELAEQSASIAPRPRGEHPLLDVVYLPEEPMTERGGPTPAAPLFPDCRLIYPQRKLRMLKCVCV